MKTCFNCKKRMKFIGWGKNRHLLTRGRVYVCIQKLENCPKYMMTFPEYFLKNNMIKIDSMFCEGKEEIQF